MTPSDLLRARLRAATGALPSSGPSILSTSPTSAAIFGATQFSAPPVNPAAVLPHEPVQIGPPPAPDHTKLWIGLGLGAGALVVLLLSRRRSS